MIVHGWSLGCIVAEGITGGIYVCVCERVYICRIRETMLVSTFGWDTVPHWHLFHPQPLMSDTTPTEKSNPALERRRTRAARVKIIAPKRRGECGESLVQSELIHQRHSHVGVQSLAQALWSGRAQSDQFREHWAVDVSECGAILLEFVAHQPTGHIRLLPEQQVRLIDVGGLFLWGC